MKCPRCDLELEIKWKLDKEIDAFKEERDEVLKDE